LAKKRAYFSSCKSNARPPVRKTVKLVSVPEDIGKRPRNIPLDGRPDAYCQIIEIGDRTNRRRDAAVLHSAKLKNKMSNAKGAYIHLKVLKGIEGYFRIQGIKSPAASPGKSRKPNVDVARDGQGVRKFTPRRSGIKRIVASHVVNNHGGLKGKDTLENLVSQVYYRPNLRAVMGYRFPGNETRAAVELYPNSGKKVTTAAAAEVVDSTLDDR